MRWICLALLLPAAASAAAPPRDRCEAGAQLVAKGDLPRAALYLDGCDEVDGFERATQQLKKKLEASQLSKLDIVTTPPGLIVEIDAFPGEHVTTPATVWVRAGHHVVTGEQVKGAVDVPPHAHATLVLDAPKAAAPPRTGHVSFEEENAGEVTEGKTLPDVKHRPMLDCKFTKSCAAAGPALDDPLALHEEAPPVHPQRMVDIRAGATAFNGHLEPTIAGALTVHLPWQDPASEHPWLASIDYSASAGQVEEMSTGLVLAKVLAAPDTAWISLGIGADYSSYNSFEGLALLDLTLRRLPIVIGARYRQRSANEHVLTLDVGYRIPFLTQ
jgi:hypothetical protein